MVGLQAEDGKNVLASSLTSDEHAASKFEAMELPPLYAFGFAVDIPEPIAPP